MPTGLGGKNTIVRVEGDNKEAVDVDDLRGDILHAAQNFYRQQAGLSANIQYAHKNVQASFLDGSSAIFDYKQNFGQEYLSVRWSAAPAEVPSPPTPVAPQPEIEQPQEVRDTICTAVFHGGNYVTAYIQGKQGLTKILSKKCKGGWGTDKILTSQFKFGGVSTVLSPLHIEDGKLVVGDTHYLTTCGPSDAAFRGFKKTTLPAYLVPFQNSDGSTLFTAKSELNNSAIAIGNDGTFYYPWIADGTVTVTSYYYYAPSAIFAAYGAEYSKYEYPTVVQAVSCTGAGKGDDIVTEISEVLAYMGDDGAGTASGSLTYDVPLPIYTPGKHDTIEVNTTKITVDINIVWAASVGGAPSTVDGQYSIDAFGESATYLWSSGPPSVTSGNELVIGIITFPPWLNTGSRYLMVKRYDADGVTEVEKHIETPYGTFSDANYLIPWLHVSNGTHFIQGFGIDGQFYLYYDTQDISGMLGDIETRDIQTIIMDIPLSRVIQLA